MCQCPCLLLSDAVRFRERPYDVARWCWGNRQYKQACKTQTGRQQTGVVPRACSNTRVLFFFPKHLLSFSSYITIACKYLDWPFLALYTYVMLLKLWLVLFHPLVGKTVLPTFFPPVTRILNFFGIAARQFALIWLCDGVLPRLSSPLPLSKGMSWSVCYTLLSWQESRRVRKEPGCSLPRHVALLALLPEAK